MPRATNSDQLHGTLDMLVLKVLDGGPLHGYAIAVRLERMSNDVFSVEEGSLYPALHRLEQRGWIEAEWGTSENNRKAKFYRLTTEGKRHLRSESPNWLKFATAVGRVLQAAQGPV